MSSPNHHTSDVEDAFSSNFPDYIPASLDYVPASPGNTYSSSFKYLFGESSRKTSLERHEEQIKEILNHLDELSLDCIEHIEYKIKGLGKGRNKSSIDTRMPPKRTSTSEAPAMTQFVDRNRPREDPVARQCSYKEFMSCQPINFKGTEGAVGLICWFERTESVFSRSNYTKDCKVKFATGTLTEEALSWWNSFAQPIGIEEAYKIT
ncbi:hypothetical protein Tco_0895336 [Tanacetum coccineum]|uniref:Reverse transcriptase domain-containing protein n=1 Tax=Tanacetum coccineum TaxID=301880 RepID=A0ABQ5CFI9_9ASTR